MNFSIHIDDQLLRELTGLVKKSGKTRNALIKEAIAKLVTSQKKKHWPREAVELFGASRDLKPFESYRAECSFSSDDPFL